MKYDAKLSSMVSMTNSYANHGKLQESSHQCRPYEMRASDIFASDIFARYAVSVSI